MEFSSSVQLGLTCSLCSLVRNQVEHSMRNSISTQTATSFPGFLISLGTRLRTPMYYPLFIIWLALRAGKMNQIARCDWLPERARWSHLARSGLPAASRKQNFTKSHIINPLLTKFVRSRWLDIGLDLLWIPTSSRSINTQEKNLANIQPSWPHTWSITHTYFLFHGCFSLTVTTRCSCKRLSDMISQPHTFPASSSKHFSFGYIS